jgi:tRNA G26 N,N-dimethylase Trm1
LWLGPLGDPKLLAGIPASADPAFAAVQLLDRLKAEADLPPFFYENPSLARTVGVADPVPVAAFLEALRAAGFRAARTHFTANGVRTDAPWEDVARLYRAAADR